MSRYPRACPWSSALRVDKKAPSVSREGLTVTARGDSFTLDSGDSLPIKIANGTNVPI